MTPTIARIWCRFSAWCLRLILAVLVAGACSGRETPAIRGVREGVLHMGNGAEPEDLDPQIVKGVTEQRLCSALFEGLVTPNPETLEPIPAVAESWRVSEDKTVYTFRLRAAAAWSNGDPVTADDFVYAWRRILTPALAAEYAYMLDCIRNAKAFRTGALTDFAQVGVKALDPRTLEVTLENPAPYFLALQFHESWYPVHKATIERFGRMEQRDTKWTRPGNLVSNGPFMLERWDPNRVIVMKKNPRYWDAGHVRLQAIRFHPIDSVQTEERSFRTGRLHLTDTIPLSKIDVYQRHDPDVLRVDPYLGAYFYRINVTQSPFTDARVRRAFAMAIDREMLANNVLKGGQKAAGCFVPPNTGGYTCVSQIPFDVARARRLLSDAGFTDGYGLPPIELLYNNSENHKVVAEAIQQMWKANLNANVTLATQDWKVCLNSMKTLEYQMVRSGWIGDYVDPKNFLECFVSGGGNNRTGYASPDYDALIAETDRVGDPAKRFDLFQRAERRLLEDAPIIPIYFYTRVYLKRPEVKGWSANPLGYMAFKEIYLEAK